MATQLAVDVFAPTWISESVSASTPQTASTATYAGRLMMHHQRGETDCMEEPGRSRDATATRHRDESLLKKTSLRHRRDSRPSPQRAPSHQKKVSKLNASDLYQDLPNRAAAAARLGHESDGFSCHGDTDVISRVGEQPLAGVVWWCETGQPDRGEASRPVPPEIACQHERDSIDRSRSSCPPLASGVDKKRKWRTGKAWRKQVHGLISLKDSDDNEGKFAPMWMKRALSKNSNREESKQGPCAVEQEETGRNFKIQEYIASPSTMHNDDEQGVDGVGVLSRVTGNGGGCGGGHWSGLSEASSVDCRIDEKSSTSLKTPAQDEFDASFEKRLDEFVLKALLTATASLLVEKVVRAGQDELEDELISSAYFEASYIRACGESSPTTLGEFPLDDLRPEVDLYDDEVGAEVKLIDMFSDESFPSDGGDSPEGGLDASGCTLESADESMTGESPSTAWVSGEEDTSMREESLINACLQRDALEHGYAASVAVVDGGGTEGLTADVRLLWISGQVHDDSFESWNSSLSIGSIGDGAEGGENDAGATANRPVSSGAQDPSNDGTPASENEMTEPLTLGGS